MRIGLARAFDFVPAGRELRRTRDEARRACDVVPAVAALGDPLQPRRPRPGRATLRRSALLAQLVEHFHGKEGVVGSSPTLGSIRKPRSGGVFFYQRPLAAAAVGRISQHLPQHEEYGPRR